MRHALSRAERTRRAAVASGFLCFSLAFVLPCVETLDMLPAFAFGEVAAVLIGQAACIAAIALYRKNS